FNVRPITGSKAKQKNSLRDVYNTHQRISSNTFLFLTPFSSYGYPVLKANGAADARVAKARRASVLSSHRDSGLVPQAGYPIRKAEV
ncbi:MAG: hypothetical protein LBS20_01715, partial [Prevotella sp.]|nr:hypothetical protein [Prevotella sp.]